VRQCRKYCTSIQDTDDNIIRFTRFSSWIRKATDTHSEYAAHLLFHGNNDYANAPLYYFTRTLPALFEDIGRHFSALAGSTVLKMTYPFDRVNNEYVKAISNIFVIIDKLKFYS